METKTIEERRLSIEVWDCHLANAVTIIAATQGRRGGDQRHLISQKGTSLLLSQSRQNWMMEDCRGLVLRHCNIFLFIFFILVAYCRFVDVVDLTYRYVIDKNIFLGKNLSSLWRWMLQIETRKNQLIFNWLLAV